MKNKRKHINLEERIKIENWLEVGIRQNKIAELLNRSKSTISKEIRRGMVLNKKTNKYEYSVLLVLVEKKTKYTLIKKLENRKNFLVNKEVFSLLKDYSVLSITTDDDIAFTKYKDLERLLNINIFFTNPYASWEKGLVENTNRWIRQFIPKKTNISLLSDKYISKIEKWLNNWPRLVLNSATPRELFSFYQFNVKINSLLIDLPERVG